MPWIIGAIVLVLVLMFGTIQIQHANNGKIAAERDAVKVDRDAAYTANKSLSASIDGVKARCDAAQKQFEDMQKNDAKRIAAAKKTIEDMNKKTAAQKATIDKLVAIANSAETNNANCENARLILDDLANYQLRSH
jgi:hypothetical protein